MRLQRLVRGTLASVRAPILAAHGARDRTANPADVDRILAAVSSPVRRRLLLENSAHIATVDYDGEALCREASEFLYAHSAAAAGADTGGARGTGAG